MAGGYFNDDQNDKMKALLYPYLMDKAQRRAQSTSGAAYDAQNQEFDAQRDEAKQGAAVSALAKWSSAMGTNLGVQAPTGIASDFFKDRSGATQQAFDNKFKARASEENSLGTDLGIAKFVGDEDYKDKDLKARTADREEERKSRLQQYLAEIQRKRDADAQHDKEFGMTYGQRERQNREGNRLREKQIDKPPVSRDPALQGPGGIVQGYVDADGNPLTYNPKTGASGSLKLPPGAKPTKTPGAEKITDTERNSAMFYGNAGNALSVLEQMEGNGYKPGAMTALKSKLTPDGLEGYTLSPDEQRYKQAAEDFTAAKLRLESGAAIPQSEIAQQARIYMLQPGDSAQVIAQKKTARRQALEGLKFKAGPGADKIGHADQSPLPSGQNDPTHMSDEELKAQYDRLKAKGHIK